jgi:hypothetical protein
MIVEKMLMAATSEGGYTPNAVKFDGANDYLSKASAIYSGTVSSGIFSVWVRYDGGPRQLLSLYDGTDEDFYFGHVYGDGSITLFLRNSANTSSLELRTAAGRLSTTVGEAKWYHILASWDSNYGAGLKLKHLYINDVSDNSLVRDTGVAFTNNYSTYTTVAIGASHSAANKLNGALAELYFTPGQYLDFSVEANRRKFIDASGLPVSLGSDGSTPTATAPAIYLKGDYSAFGTNSGTGGNFTVNGALEKASTTPATLPAFNAVDFDGTSDYLTRGADLTGNVDSKKGILSAWIRFDGLDGTTQYIINAQGGYFNLTKNTSNYLIVDGYSSTGVLQLQMRTTTAITASPKFRHLLMAWDLTVPAAYCYLDGVSDKTAVTEINSLDIDYTRTNYGVAASAGSTSPVNGAISELYFAPNQYLDLSVQANREKFILNGAPVSLGSDGSTPTGVAPAIYLPNRAALVGTNAGSGGNFTINGAPKDANSTPVYYYAEPVKFDGTNDYLVKTTNLTGATNGKTGTVSFWLRLDGSDSSHRAIIDVAEVGIGTTFAVSRLAANTIRFFGGSAGSANLNMATVGTFLASPVWVHIMASWSLSASSVTHIYVNNVSDKAVTTANNGNLDFGQANNDWQVGASYGGGDKLFGTIADLWFNTTYLDISQASNRAKFIDQTTLRPVSLGAKGELPTGSQPLLYLGRDFSNFQTNLGSGGNFTVTGALERGTTSPSDVRA